MSLPASFFEGEYVLPRDVVRQLDQVACDSFGLPGLVLMENAARGITDIYLREFQLQATDCTFIFCGTGNNAGDGFAIARQLQVRHRPVRVFLCTDPVRLRGDARIQYELARRLNIKLEPLFDVSCEEDVYKRLEIACSAETPCACVDALLGTGAVGTPGFPMNSVIKWLNRVSSAGIRTLAVDLPSGLDCDTGQPFAKNPDEVVHAALTVTLAASKPGLILKEAVPFVGKLKVSDIGISVGALLRERTNLF